CALLVPAGSDASHFAETPVVAPATIHTLDNIVSPLFKMNAQVDGAAAAAQVISSVAPPRPRLTIPQTLLASIESNPISYQAMWLLWYWKGWACDENWRWLSHCSCSSVEASGFSGTGLGMALRTLAVGHQPRSSPASGLRASQGPSLRWSAPPAEPSRE